LLQRTGTEISQKNISEQVSTECKATTNGHTPRLRARGGIWEERNAKTKVKFKVKFKAKVGRGIHPHQDHV
jgi:hypothetical protein